MFAIVPLFGLASPGVTIGGLDSVLSPLPLGVALGLFIGKQVGVFGAIRLADRLGTAREPGNLGWTHIHGAALLCGIGFTISLFIGELAFADPALVDAAKIGTLLGSSVSLIAGCLVLQLAAPAPPPDIDRDEAAEVFGEDADEEPGLDDLGLRHAEAG